MKLVDEIKNIAGKDITIRFCSWCGAGFGIKENVDQSTDIQSFESEHQNCPYIKNDSMVLSVQ